MNRFGSIIKPLIGSMVLLMAAFVAVAALGSTQTAQPQAQRGQSVRQRAACRLVQPGIM
jgi:hypothetical protein